MFHKRPSVIILDLFWKQAFFLYTVFLTTKMLLTKNGSNFRKLADKWSPDQDVDEEGDGEVHGRPQAELR